MTTKRPLEEIPLNAPIRGEHSSTLRMYQRPETQRATTAKREARRNGGGELITRSKLIWYTPAGVIRWRNA